MKSSNVIVFLGHTSTVVHIKERNQPTANAINKVLYELHDYSWDNKLKRYIHDRNYYKLDRDLGLIIIPKAYTEKLLQSLKDHNVQFVLDKVQDIPVKNINASMLPGWVDKPEQVGPIKHLTDRKSSMKYLALQTGCLAGSNKVRFNRASRGFSMDLKTAYMQFNHSPGRPARKWDPSITTNVRALQEGVIKLHPINEISFSGIQSVYRLTLENGLFVDCTKRHLIKTDLDWMAAEECVGQMVMFDTPKAVAVLDSYAKMKDASINVSGLHPFARPFTSHGVKRYRIALHRAIYEAYHNNMSLDEFKEAIADPEKIKELNFFDPAIFVVHHKDHDHYNQEPENLTHLTHKEHQLHHGEKSYGNFNQGIPQYSKGISWEYLGEEETFDIGCDAPYHNFTANDIVVHNSGKTYSAIKACTILAEPFMVITSRLVTQWVDSVKSQTNLTDDDIFIIKGSPSVEEIIKKNLKPKCIIASLETMRNLCSNNNSIVSIDDLCYHVGIGTKIVDECHENFHAIVMIDLSMNIRNNIYLTATFIRTNPSTNKIFNAIFTKEERYGEGDYERYADVKMFGYASYTPEKLVRMNGSYNHHKYEAFLLRKEPNVHWFCSHVLKRVIEERYIKIKKPGQKLLIILSRTDSIYRVVAKLRTLYPDLRVEPFTQAESTDNLEADIIISTPGSAGTGRHIDNLVSMICTISMAAPGKLMQLLGRLRKLKDSVVYYSDLFNESSSDHVRHAEDRVSLFKRLAATFSTGKL